LLVLRRTLQLHGMTITFTRRFVVTSSINVQTETSVTLVSELPGKVDGKFDGE
jgi:hypothetical protein